MSEPIEIKKVRQADDVYLCQSDVLALIAKEKYSASTVECRDKLQNLLKMIADAS